MGGIVFDFCTADTRADLIYCYCRSKSGKLYLRIRQLVLRRDYRPSRETSGDERPA